MEYIDIIKDNVENNTPVKWWPKFAYHHTDVSNAVNILSTGFLYSRDNAKKMGLMINDNASRQVIDMTNISVLSNVRFYFRPLTPTQYYNEGYKHPALRYDNDSKANIPVPVFFLFDLAKLLSLKGVKFSERRQAGSGSELYEGVDAFSKLDFKKIYSIGFDNFEENKPYRHAEILHPDSMRIDSCIDTILCRNSVERMTLLNLLREKNPLQYRTYKDRIKICKSDMFEYNGLYITECNFYNNTLSVRFSDTSNKRNYTNSQMRKHNLDKLESLTVKVVLDWYTTKNLYEHKETTTIIEYDDINAITFSKLPTVPNAKFLRVMVYIEENLMCCVEHSLEQTEIIK